MMRTLRRICFSLLAALAVLALLGACVPDGSTPPPDGQTPTPVPLTPRPSAPASAPTAVPSKPAAANGNELVAWIGDDFPLDSAGGQALWNARAAFQAANPPLRVNLLQKKSGGKGGIEDLLGAALAAQPQAVPDIVTLDLRDLPRYVRNGLVQPLDAQGSQALLNDLYPFARLAAQSDNRVYAVPFTADVLHVVYDTGYLKSAPLTWTELISTGARYAFAAGGDNGIVGDAFLTQYVALGGRFADARGRSALDRTPLIDALEFYRSAVTKGTAVTNTLSLVNEEDTLKLFESVRVPLADVTARGYLRDRDQLRGASFAAVPTRDGNLATIAHAWGLAVVSRDPARRATAQRLVESLVSTESNAAWNRAAGRLPVRRSALNGWSSDTYYREFANQMLSVAVNRPVPAAGSSPDVVLQLAVLDVLANGVTPAEAADKAIAALNR